MATQISRATNTGSMALAMACWLLTRYLASEFFNLLSTLYRLALVGGGGFRGSTRDMSPRCVQRHKLPSTERAPPAPVQGSELSPGCAVLVGRGLQRHRGAGARALHNRVSSSTALCLTVSDS